jgi:hypothetical protein
VFGGFCLLLFLPRFFFPFRGVVFLMPVFGVFLLGQACSDSNSARFVPGVFVWRV